MELERFVKDQIERLIEGVVKEAGRAEKDTSAGGVHDLRVAIRRLSEVLKVFPDLFPQGAAQMVRRDLKVAMRLAGEVRNHDIAAELMEKAQIAVAPTVRQDRTYSAEKLSTFLGTWNHGVTFRAWKDQLYV